ncbi:MAG: hypothetical protein DGJ47_000991, partial [Rickettsiaceae bacterium]
KNLDNASISYTKSKVDLEQSVLDQDLITEKLTLLKIKLLNAQAQYNTALAENVLAKENLNSTIIRAPISGLLANSILRKGSFVNSGRVLFSVVPIDQLYIKANYKETQIAKFKPGLTAEIFIDAVKGEKIVGHIRNISPATGSKFSLIPAQNATGNFTKVVQRVPVIIDFEVPAHLRDRIMPGMSSFIKIKSF